MRCTNKPYFPGIFNEEPVVVIKQPSKEEGLEDWIIILICILAFLLLFFIILLLIFKFSPKKEPKEEEPKPEVPEDSHKLVD